MRAGAKEQAMFSERYTSLSSTITTLDQEPHLGRTDVKEFPPGISSYTPND